MNKLHGLSYEVRHSEGWKSCSFSIIHEFIVKMSKLTVMDVNFEEFSVLSCRDFVNKDWFEMLLYPLTAVKHYRKRTQHYHESCRNFLIFIGWIKKCITRNTIPFQLRAIIYHTCRTATREDCRAVKIKAHKVCSIVPSVLSRILQPINFSGWNMAVTDHNSPYSTLGISPQILGNLLHYISDVTRYIV